MILTAALDNTFQSFEVDFDDFTQRSCEGCPPQFLELAKRCCQVVYMFTLKL